MPDPLLWTRHDPWLVALSLLVAMGGANVAMHLADLAGKARLGREHIEWTWPRARWHWAVAFGPFYIGMLAFGVCGEANFDSWMTVLSILPGLAASWVALGLLARRAPSAGVLWGSGALMGAGIGAMHYIDMAASELVPLVALRRVGFSLVFGGCGSCWPCWRCRFGPAARAALGHRLDQPAGRLHHGPGDCGLHYSGNSALRFAEPLVELHHGSHRRQ